MDLQELGDRADIEATLVRYTRAIDTGEWDALDTVFTPDAQIDYTSTGGIAGAFAEVKPWLAEMLPLFPRRMHTLGQVSISFGDEAGGSPPKAATVAAYFHNPMGMPQEDGPDHLVEFGGIYHHDFVRTPQGWRSRRLVEQLVWKRGM
jgi:SnoaL-like protein